MDQALNSQKTWRASYGMSFVSILMKNDRVIKGFYCNKFLHMLTSVLHISLRALRFAGPLRVGQRWIPCQSSSDTELACLMLLLLCLFCYLQQVVEQTLVVTMIRNSITFMRRHRNKFAIGNCFKCDDIADSDSVSESENLNDITKCLSTMCKTNCIIFGYFKSSLGRICMCPWISFLISF